MKRRILCLLLALLLVPGCGKKDKTNQTVEPTEATTLEEKIVEKSGVESIPIYYASRQLDANSYTTDSGADGAFWSSTVSFPQVYLMGEEKEKYFSLNEAFAAMNDSNEAIAKSTFDELSEWAEEAAELGSAQSNLFDESTIAVKRADEVCVSFLTECSSYTGGAHPNYYYFGTSFDTLTGEELQLSDVLYDMDSLAKILEDKLTEKYDDMIFFGDLDSQFGEYQMEHYTWTLGYDGVTFYFDPYEIASFADGMLCATIAFDEYPDMFNEKYTKAADDYIVTILPGEDMDFDFDGDGKKADTVAIYAMTDAEGAYDSVLFDVNGKSSEYDVYGYNAEYYYVHSNGKDYFWVCLLGDGAYSEINIYTIKDGDVLFSDTHTMAGFHMPRIDLREYALIPETDEAIYSYLDFVPTNPDKILIDTCLDMLGTTFGTKEYYVDAKDGTLKTNDTYYDMSGKIGTLVSKIDIEVYIPETGKTETIPAMTEFAFVKSDGATFVDMVTSDGKECRVYVSEGNMINGVHQNQCFEGIVYAG